MLRSSLEIHLLAFRTLPRELWKQATPSHLLNIFLICLLLFILLFAHKEREKDEYVVFPPVYRDFDLNTSSSGHRLLCMVLTTPVNYLTKAVHIQATWGRRCDTLLFISSSERGLVSWFITPKVVSDLPVRELTGVEGREYLWEKVKNGLRAVWRDYSDQFDFLIKADDDTFLIVDNLKHLLSKRLPNDPFILGHQQEDRSVAYMSGGSGYVLSHTAVKDIVEVGLSGHQPCHLPHPVGQEIEVYPNEDLQMGKCAAILNIRFQSSEIHGHSTFLPFAIQQHLLPGLSPAWWIARTWECRNSAECVSPSLVCIHYVSPEMMYVYEYFVYAFHREI